MSTDTAETATDVVAALDATDPNITDTLQDETDPEGSSAGTPDESIEGEEALRDPGKQALDRMKKSLKAEREKVAQLKAELDKHTPEDDPERIRRDAEQAAQAKANGRILSAEIRAAATGKLADPADALTFIDMDQFHVDEDGSVDQEEIAHAITDLLETKPYLAAQGGTKKTPKPDSSQGAGAGSTASTADQFAQAIGNFI